MRRVRKRHFGERLMGAREDGALFNENALKFGDIRFQHPWRNIIFCAKSGGHASSLPRHHRLHQESLIGFAMRRNRFAGYQEILDIPGNKASIGDVMGSAVLGTSGGFMVSRVPGPTTWTAPAGKRSCRSHQEISVPR